MSDRDSGNEGPIFNNFSFFKDFIYLFLERAEEKEKGRERNIYVWLPLVHPLTGDLACNPGMCPDWALNWRPFGLQARTQSTEPHQPGLIVFLFKGAGIQIKYL